MAEEIYNSYGMNLLQQYLQDNGNENNVDLSTSDLNSIFSAADKDGDGEISKSEFDEAAKTYFSEEYSVDIDIIETDTNLSLWENFAGSDGNSNSVSYTDLANTFAAEGDSFSSSASNTAGAAAEAEKTEPETTTAYNEEDGTTTKTTYDSDGNISEITVYDTDGAYTKTSYDSNGNMTEQKVCDVDGYYSITTYNDDEKPLTKSYYGAEGDEYKTTNYEYLENGNTIEETETIKSDGTTAKSGEQYYTDNNGNKVIVNEYDYVFDEDGNTTGKEGTWYNADGSINTNYEFHYEYDDNGKLISAKLDKYDEDGNVQHNFDIVYDENGEEKERTETIYDEDGTKLSYGEYDNIGRAEEITVYDGDGAYTKTSYDSNGKMTEQKVCDVDGYYSITTYNNDEEPSTKTYYGTEGEYKKTIYEYNEKDGTSTATTYDSDGNVSEIAVYDDEGGYVITSYDSDGNITEKRTGVENNWSETTTYDEDGSYTVIKYDADGNVSNTTNYDAEGNIIPELGSGSETAETSETESTEETSEAAETEDISDALEDSIYDLNSLAHNGDELEQMLNDNDLTIDEKIDLLYDIKNINNNILEEYFKADDSFYVNSLEILAEDDSYNADDIVGFMKDYFSIQGDEGGTGDDVDINASNYKQCLSAYVSLYEKFAGDAESLEILNNAFNSDKYPENFLSADYIANQIRLKYKDDEETRNELLSNLLTSIASDCSSVEASDYDLTEKEAADLEQKYIKKKESDSLKKILEDLKNGKLSDNEAKYLIRQLAYDGDYENIINDFFNADFQGNTTVETYTTLLFSLYTSE